MEPENIEILVGAGFNGTWPEVIPFGKEMEQQEEYPIGCFPLLMYEACTEYQQYAQQPIPLIGAAALATLSLACQGVADVARDTALRSPVSLYLLSIAESGERKSAADSFFSEPIKNWEVQKRDLIKSETREKLARHQAWDAERVRLEKASAEANPSNGNKVKELRLKLERHSLNKPEPLRIPCLFHQSITQEALFKSLVEGWPSSSLWCGEAGLIVGSHSMTKDNLLKFISFLNQLWHGERCTHETKQSGNWHVEGRRFTCSLMLQEAVFKQLHYANGGLLRGVGLFSRMLIAAPKSTMGTRHYREAPSFDAKSPFYRRIIELLDLGLKFNESGALLLPVLSLSSAAKATWVKYYNQIESQLSVMGEFFEARDFASKSGEMAARIAGCFHIFEHGSSGEISEETMMRAIKLAGWYLREARRIFADLNSPLAFKDAALLLNWLTRKQKTTFTMREIQQYGPYRLRRKNTLESVLEVLERGNYTLKEPLGPYHVNPSVLI